MPWLSRTRLRTAGAVLAAALIGSALAVPAAQAEPPGGPLTDLVNPFIGSQNDGNTYPGAAVPFGMVQLSPDTGHFAGYSYDDDRIRGFSAVHLSGVGCGLGGDLPVLPTTGDITETDYAKYASGYRHDDESARPGSYRVGLTSYGGITAELTATARTGKQRYTFPATDKANVLLNAGQSLHKTVSTRVEVLDSRTIRTAITGRGFCQDTEPYTVYTITRFDRPFTSYGTWDGDKVTAGSKGSTAAWPTRCLRPLRHPLGPHRRGDHRAQLCGRGGRGPQSARRGRQFLRPYEGGGRRRLGAAAGAGEDPGRRPDAAPDLLLLALPVLPRAEHRQ